MLKCESVKAFLQTVGRSLGSGDVRMRWFFYIFFNVFLCYSKLLAGLLDPATSECDVFLHFFYICFMFFTNCWQGSWIWRRQNEMCDSVIVWKCESIKMLKCESVFMNCWQVSWIRRRQNEMSLLTTDRLVFSADNRYSVVQVSNGSWTMDTR